ncbi:MAG: hypothetical protein PHI34_04460 [Acidobacteriota bacterium]|nr:hypothetical protein [Acidobacteriota bacterium]
MTPTPADFFRCFPAAADFARAIRALEGEFAFDTAAMIDLGRAYFEVYPDTAAGRDLDAVRAGYAIVRVCAVERMIRGLSPEGKDFYRSVFDQPSRMKDLISARIGAKGETGPARPRLLLELASVSEALDGIRAEIEAVPKGMIKERFIGGISLLTNGLFLVRTLLQRAADSSAGS